MLRWKERKREKEELPEKFLLVVVEERVERRLTPSERARDHPAFLFIIFNNKKIQ